MQILSNLLPILAAAATAAATALADVPHILAKRCSPVTSPDYYHGYLPPAPCWQDFDPACRPYIRQGTEQYISESRRTVVVLGVPEYCFLDIAEEQARQADGRLTYGWEQKYGKLTRAPGTDVLVISNMTAEAIQKYKELKYKGQ